ncbi:MAG: hypothetical protein CUN56_01230 [Phototrophicales bacterium]|nr:MAG: hypothetical protein CUN56_01230 [Phototrophicales bacterium]RMG72394.1 MAG: hypothetical protein D6711_13050 [Chloroflexota bacterium]
MSQVYIVTTVPEDSLEPVLDAISSAGGGIIGHYTHCAFTNAGIGRFKPGDSAKPHLGDVGKINAEPEWRIETFCDRTQAKAVVEAIRAAHPYEQPVIYVIPLLDINTL